MSGETREKKVRTTLPQLNAEIARSIVDYDPETGVFRWRERSVEMFRDTPGRTAVHACANWNAQHAGKVTGSPNKGYTEICIFLRNYRAHRLAWLIMTGAWPEADIDHENLDRSDNRWTNLRMATMSQNLANTRMRRTNTSGFKGVSWSKRIGKWQAHIMKDGRSIGLGYFSTPEAAHAAYRAAAHKHFGEFARAV